MNDNIFPQAPGLAKGNRRRGAAALFLALLWFLWCFPVVGLGDGVEYAEEGFVYRFNSEDGNPHCASILMVNIDTDTVVYALNPDEPRPMASMTKIMSYIVTVEAIEDLMGTRVSVPASVAETLEGTGSSLADIAVGEEFSVYELLHLMMIPSGNDAALTLATYIDGLRLSAEDLFSGPKIQKTEEKGKGKAQDEEAPSVSEAAEKAEDVPGEVLSFVDMMNRKARILGCTDTHFLNPHGLHEEGHYASARDLMTITEYAMTKPYFAEIVGMTYYEQPPTNINPNPHTVYNTNKMIQQSDDALYYAYATGVKTGSLDQSGYCISASATYQGYTYFVVAMGHPYRYEDGTIREDHGEMLDAAELFRWAFNQLQIKTIAENGQLLGDIDLRYSWNQDKLHVVAAENIRAVLPATVESSSIIAELNVPEVIDAPVKKGDRMGVATLTYADQVIGSVDVVAGESVERSEMMRTLEQGRIILKSRWFQVVLLSIAALVLLYLALMLFYRAYRIRKQKQRKRRYNKRKL